MSVVDRSFWISWYDVAEERCDDYLCWLVDRYLPAVEERGGILWGAHYMTEADALYSGKKGRLTRTSDTQVPAGTQHITLFCGIEPHVFVEPPPAKFHASLPEEDRRMLALRSGERSNIMIEQARVHGPEARMELAPAPCIQLGSFNSASYEDEDELAAWYAEWYLSSTAHIPGCVLSRKLISVSGWAKHAVLFEFDSLEARNEHFVNHEQDRPDMAAWTDKVVRRLIHAPGSPAVARRVWPPVD
jgi:hypothetical protein